jgi:hypothetical protein
MLTAAINKLWFTIILGLAAFVATEALFHFTAAAQSEARVTEVIFKADDALPTRQCPYSITFGGSLTTNGPATVKYTFTRSDGATGPVHTLEFAAAGTQTVSTTWTLGDATIKQKWEGWQALKVLSPNEIESSHESGSFSLTCIGGTKASANKEGQELVAVVALPSSVTASPQPDPSTDSKKEIFQTEQIVNANKAQAAPGKFAGRKGAPVFNFQDVPAASAPLRDLTLQTLSPAAIAEIGRVKTPRVSGAATAVDSSALLNATREVDPRLRGPNLSNTPGASEEVDVASAGENVYVVWADQSRGNSEILLAVSTDHGASFWPAVNLSNTPSQSRNPRIAASGDQVYIVWEEQVAFSIGFFTISTDGADTFSAPAQLDTMLGDTFQPQVIASGGHGYAVWREVERNVVTFSAGDEHVRFRDLGESRPTTIVRVPWHVQDVSVASGGSNVYVTWNANFRGRDLDPYFSTSTDGGRTFRVDQYPEDQASPQGDYGDQMGGGVAAAGNTFVWYYESNRDFSRTVRLEASRDGSPSHFDGRSRFYALNRGVTYPNPTDEAFRAPMAPSFTVDGADRFAGAWVVSVPRLSGFQRELHYWESDHPENVLTTSGNPRDPHVAAQAGTSAVVFTNTAAAAGTRPDVFAFFLGSRLGFYNVSSNTGTSSQPKVVASGPNYVVVWKDDTPGNTEIFFRAIPAR